VEAAEELPWLVVSVVATVDDARIDCGCGYCSLPTMEQNPTLEWKRWNDAPELRLQECFPIVETLREVLREVQVTFAANHPTF
jgi:hypothetical protein